MDPLALLRDEHRLVLKELYSIDKRLARLESSDAGKAFGLLSSLERDGKRFWNGLSLHFYREEKALFSVLEKRLGHDKEMVQVMKHEHETLLASLMLLRSEIERMRREGDTIRTWELVSSLQGLRAGLSDHISREERVLFWLAELRLSDVDEKKISFDLAQIAGPYSHG